MTVLPIEQQEKLHTEVYADVVDLGGATAPELLERMDEKRIGRQPELVDVEEQLTALTAAGLFETDGVRFQLRQKVIDQLQKQAAA